MSLIKLAALVMLLAAISSMPVAQLKLSKYLKGVDMCSTCVTFGNDNLSQLYQNVTGPSIPSNCTILCKDLADSLTYQICIYLCNGAGLNPFISDVQKANPDPIYFCELLNSCPTIVGGAASISNTYVVPTSGTVGTTFKVEMTFAVTNTTGTGQVKMTVNPPDSTLKPFSSSYLNEGFEIGSYSAKFEIKTNSSYPVGNYTGTLQVCSGTCGMTNPNEVTLSSANVKFTIK